MGGQLLRHYAVVGPAFCTVIRRRPPPFTAPEPDIPDQAVHHEAE
jgi:hypothetical protein